MVYYSMNFIQKIIDNHIDNLVHFQFQKFSRGEFTNRALVQIKKTGEKYTIATSAEFANDLVCAMAEKLGSATTRVTGAIVSTSDLSGKLTFTDKKQFQGVKRYLLDQDMSGTQLLALLEEFPLAFFALSFQVGEDKLKIKPKAPKSGKPGSKGEEAPKIDFCRLVTTDATIGKGFCFEKETFKEARIAHTFVIERLEIPEEIKKSNDFSRMREEAKRVGTLIRTAIIDGKEIKKTFSFSV